MVAGLLVGCGDDPDSPGSGDDGTGTIDRCDWPMWGQGIDRTFSYPCETAVAPDTVEQLQQAWFFTTDDAVTATPAVVDGTAYVGDWSGRFYAVDVETGELVWSYRTEVHPTVYAGQIVSSAAVADAGGRRVVYFGGGKTLYALDAADGDVVWTRELGRGGDDSDPTEIESSPVVVEGLVIFGTDVHNSPAGEPAGVVALDAETGAPQWTATTAPTDGDDGGVAGDEGDGAGDEGDRATGDADPTGPGCGDVWGSPSVDGDRRLVFVGTGNCGSAGSWGSNSEAIVALDLDTGQRRWSYQPHEQSLDDLDFAGAPNLFRIGDQDVVGLGNKDGVYYVVRRDDGRPVWQRQAAEPGIPEPGGNYSTGGFIGPTAQAGDLVVGGTAVGGEPYLHAFDAATGEIAWQQPAAGPTYAAAAEANGVVFLGGTDFTFRAVDLSTGEVLWSQEVQGAVSGGAVVVGASVLVVAGLREPGQGNVNRTAGLYRFTLDEVSSSSTSAAPTTAAPEPAGPLDPAALAQPCVAAPCPLGFDLSAERVAGAVGSGTVHVSAAPFRVEVRAEGLGPPERWLRPGSSAAAAGAEVYAVYLSQGTDNPVGGLVCVLDEHDDCTSTDIPDPGAPYDRISILAVADPGELPSITEGFDRLVTTNSFDVPFAPLGG
jgi:outer membrane protein assembly factor BamB